MKNVKKLEKFAKITKNFCYWFWITKKSTSEKNIAEEHLELAEDYWGFNQCQSNTRFEKTQKVDTKA